jgi:hypothetical protein
MQSTYVNICQHNLVLFPFLQYRSKKLNKIHQDTLRYIKIHQDTQGQHERIRTVLRMACIRGICVQGESNCLLIWCDGRKARRGRAVFLFSGSFSHRPSHCQNFHQVRTGWTFCSTFCSTFGSAFFGVFLSSPISVVHSPYPLSHSFNVLNRPGLRDSGTRHISVLRDFPGQTWNGPMGTASVSRCGHNCGTVFFFDLWLISEYFRLNYVRSSIWFVWFTAFFWSVPVQSIDSFDVHSCTNLSQVGSLGVHSKSKKRKPLHCTSKVGFRTLVRPGKASSMLLCRDVMHPCVFWTSSAQVVPSVKDDFYIYIFLLFSSF